MGTGAYFAELIEDAVKIDQYLALGNLGDVVHSLTCVVTNPSILICEASEDWGHNLVQISGQVLRMSTL